jgi:4'-phosphopantetheinyl transferase EntD
VIEEILPAGVTSADSTEDIPCATLFPVETARIARAVGTRRAEFATGRACARRALEGLGVPPTAIPTGPRGEPQWPPGVVGSITHCAGYRAAATAHSAQFQSIGIDAEPHSPVPDGVLDAVAVRAELAWIADLRRMAPERYWDCLLFSAKESVFKAWYPLTREWLGFGNAVISVDAAHGTFSAYVSPDVGGGRRFAGRWTVTAGLVLTAVVVHAG